MFLSLQAVMWIGFAVLIALLLALDLGVFNRQAHEIKTGEAFWTSMFWIGISLVFNALVFYVEGVQKGLEFFTGYLIEKALSVDNIFVFVVIFSYFQVPARYQHRVLFLGILGAIVLRGALIFLGTALIHQFEWIVYLFGVFLLATAYRLARQREHGVKPDKNPVVNFFRRFMPVSPHYDGNRFFTRVGGTLMATPLMVVLIVVETTDLVFAVDSIPAIFAITTDPFIVLTSNVFAILGLRALYFLLAGMIGSFRYLKLGLSFVLGFVGIKMLLGAAHIEIPIVVSLGIIATALTVAIVASLVAERREQRTQPVPSLQESSDS